MHQVVRFDRHASDLLAGMHEACMTVKGELERIGRLAEFCPKAQLAACNAAA